MGVWEIVTGRDSWPFFKKGVFMKSLLGLILPLIFLSCSKVPAGHVGIKFYLLGSSKGVDSEELSPGRYWIGMNEELYLFPTFQQNTTWQIDNGSSFIFQSREGLSIGADIGLSYHLDPTKINTIFQKYRKGMDEITEVFMRNHIRNALNEEASLMEVTDIYGKGKSQFIKNVTQRVTDATQAIGINVDKIYLIGGLELPSSVVRALNLKIEATQRAQQRENEIQETIAEANKRREEAKGKAEAILAVARAQSRANRMISESISPQLVRYNSIEKWNGILPTVTSGTPLINLKGL